MKMIIETKTYIQKILRIFSSTPHDQKTIEDVHRWLIDDSAHAAEKEAALREIWDNTENVWTPQAWESYAKVREKINLRNTGRKARFVSLQRKSLKYAAAVLLLLASASASYFLAKRSNHELILTEYFSSIGDKGTVILPDGSRVMTNSTTLLVYPDAFASDVRTVYLVGEANFSVQKDPKRPFIVKTDQLDITALGTQFNVKSYPDDPFVNTTLIEGSIQVKSKNKPDVRVLTPGEQLVYDKETRNIQVSVVDLEDVTAWQRDELVFKSIEIKDILRMLERKYEITFQYKSGTLNNDKYNFRFKENAPLDEIMDIIQTVANTFDYTIKDKVCYLSKHP